MINGEDGMCDCTRCHIERLAEEVAELRERVHALEESRSLDVLGTVLPDGTVDFGWKDKT